MILSCRWRQRMLLAGFLVTLALAPRQSSAQQSARNELKASRPASAGSLSEQAKRGKKQFTESCALCHAEDLAGRDPAPALTGNKFLKKWQGSTLWDLFDKIRKTMPQEDRGSLSPKTYLDIVAYMVKFNDIDVGSNELKNDPKTLKSVVIRKPDPSHPSL